MDALTDLDPYTVRPPNIRACFVPDPGFVLVEADLKQADAQVAAWDADCPGLKHAFRTGEDIHTDNAVKLYGDAARGRVHSAHVNGMSYRDNAKRWVHAANFGGGAKTIASAIVLPQDHVASCIHWWTRTRHPALHEWHRRLEWELTTSRTPSVRNAFGFRRAYAGGDRAGNLLGQAIAWICQSTTAIVINHALLAVDCARDLVGQPRCGTCLCCENPTVQPLLQVHDSLLLQVPEALWPALAPRLLAAMRVEVPYDDPLVIPTEIKWSATDWGSMDTWHADA